MPARGFCSSPVLLRVPSGAIPSMTSDFSAFRAAVRALRSAVPRFTHTTPPASDPAQLSINLKKILRWYFLATNPDSFGCLIRVNSSGASAKLMWFTTKIQLPEVGRLCSPTILRCVNML